MAARGTPAENMGILIVEDEEFQRRLVARLLRDLGAAAVFEAGDGAEALALLRGDAGRVDFVLCDLEMPVLDGFAFLEAVRGAGNSSEPALPVVVLTGYRQVGLLDRAMAMGATGYLVKPVMKAELMALLERLRR
ncbi:MAG: response regulator [Azospirillum sp.]|nr:response regulator [Azospirillum sp.]